MNKYSIFYYFTFFNVVGGGFQFLNLKFKQLIGTLGIVYKLGGVLIIDYPLKIYFFKELIRKRKLTLLKSPHVNKTARTQVEGISQTRCFRVLNNLPPSMVALRRGFSCFVENFHKLNILNPPSKIVRVNRFIYRVKSK